MLILQDKRLAWTEFKVCTQVVIASCQDVLGSLGVVDDLCITLDLHGGRLCRTVEDGEYCMPFVLAGDDIDTVIGDELYLLALANNLVALSPMQ